MNKYQIAKNDAYKMMVVEARANQPATDSIPRFSKGIDRLEQITLEVDKIKIEQEADITGITEDKNVTQEEVCDYLLDIAGAVHSYAHYKNDHALMAKVDFKPGNVEKMIQADVITAAETVKNEAARIPVADLAEEGVSAAELEEFTKLIEAFKKAKPAPREATIDRTGYTRKLKELFTEASKLVKGSLNRLLLQFKRKNPDFYLKFRAASNIIYKRPSDPNNPQAKQQLV